MSPGSDGPAPDGPVVVLAVAGTDPTGGAGLAADLRTFAALGVHGAVAVAAVTVQDGASVARVEACDAALVKAQIGAVTGRMRVAATKTGLLATVANAEAVAACPGLGPLVVDPVLRASSGGRLAADGMADAYRRWLFPLAAVVTPNLEEAAALTGRPVEDLSGMRRAAGALVEQGAAAVVVTGGHLPGDQVVDVFFDGDERVELAAPRLAGANTRGTGCTFSSAVAAQLALGRSPAEAFGEAATFVRRALAGATGWRLGGGPGPLDQLGWSAGRDAGGFPGPGERP